MNNPSLSHNLSFSQCFVEVSAMAKKLKKADYNQSGSIPIIDQGKGLIGGYTDDLSFVYQGELPCIVFGDHTKQVKYIDFPFAIGAEGVKIFRTTEYLDIKYGYFYLKSLRLPSLGYSRHFKLLKKQTVVVPPLVEQKSLSFLLSSIQNLIDKRILSIDLLNEYIESYFLEMFGDPVSNPYNWEMQRLDKLGEWKTGGTPQRSKTEYYENGTIPWFSSGELNDVFVSSSQECITEHALRVSGAKKVLAGSLMVGMYDTAALKTSIAAINCSCNQAIAFSHLDGANPLFALYCIQVSRNHFLKQRRGVRQKNLSLSYIKSIKLITPPFSLQDEFERKYLFFNKKRAIYEESLQLLNELLDALSIVLFTSKKTEVSKYASHPTTIEETSLLIQSVKDSRTHNIISYSTKVDELFKVLDSTRANQQKNNLTIGIIQLLVDDTIKLFSVPNDI